MTKSVSTMEITLQLHFYTRSVVHLVRVTSTAVEPPSLCHLSLIMAPKRTASILLQVYSTITPGKTQRLCKFIDVEHRYWTLSVPLMLNEDTTIDHVRPDPLDD